MDKAGLDLAGSVIAWIISSGAGIYVAKWLGTNFFEWLKSYNTRLVAVEKSIVKVGDDIDKRLIKIETTLDLTKNNRPMTEEQVIRVFEDNVLKIVRKKLNKH